MNEQTETLTVSKTGGEPTLLAISPVAPWPMRNGFTLRCASLLEELAEDWQITLVAPEGPGGKPDSVPLANRVMVNSGVGPVAVPSQAERTPLRQAVARMGGFDRFSAALLWAGTEFVAAELQDFPPAVCDRIDCMTLMRWRSRVHCGGVRERLSAYRALAEALWYERSTAKKLEAMVVVGEDDASTLRRISGSDRVHVIPNGVTVRGLPDPDAKSLVPTVLFSGVLSYAPNVKAVRWFARHVWPTVHAQMPEAILELAGRSPNQAVRNLAERAGVRLRPDVPDMRAVQRNAWLAVAPMRSGSGIKNKVLEAWAAGTPVVMTQMATNGLRIDEPMSDLVTDDPDRMASMILRLLRNCTERERRAANGYALAARHHSWAGAGDHLSRLLASASANRGRSHKRGRILKISGTHM